MKRFIEIYSILSFLAILYIPSVMATPAALVVSDQPAHNITEARRGNSEIDIDFGIRRFSSMIHSSELTIRQSVFVRNLTTDNVAIDRISVPFPWSVEYLFKLNNKPLTIESLSQEEIEVVADASLLSPGSNSSKIQFFLPHQGEAAATIYVHGMVDKGYAISPSTVDLGNITVGETAKAQFRIVVDPKLIDINAPTYRTHLPRFSAITKDVSVTFVSATEGTPKDWGGLPSNAGSSDKIGDPPSSPSPTILTYEVTIRGSKTRKVLEWLSVVPVADTIGALALRNVAIPIVGTVIPKMASSPHAKDACNCTNIDK